MGGEALSRVLNISSQSKQNLRKKRSCKIAKIHANKDRDPASFTADIFILIMSLRTLTVGEQIQIIFNNLFCREDVLPPNKLT